MRAFVLIAWVALVSAALAGGVSSQAAVRSSSDESLEYRIKAAYLINFTRYIDWPAEAFHTSTAPITICVLGTDPFGSLLDAALAGRTSQGRPLAGRRIRSAQEATGCQLVFVSRAAWNPNEWPSREPVRPGVVTVGESEEFARRGGVIGFVIVNETVRFVVNREAQERAGLRISSRMLALAASVYGQEPSR